MCGGSNCALVDGLKRKEIMMNEACPQHPGARIVQKEDGSPACLACVFAEVDDPGLFLGGGDDDDD